MQISTLCGAGVIILVLGIIGKRVHGLIINYQKARKLQIPIKIIPFNRQDDLWLLVWRQFYTPIRALLPTTLSSWLDYSHHGWNVHIRLRPHLKTPGDLFVLVTPNENEIVFTDPTAGMELESKYKTWMKPQHHYHIFNIFGRNLLTVNGDEWQRHRKISSPAFFRDATHELVWNESRRQASQMFATAARRGVNSMETVKDDGIIFAMHVLADSVFGHQYDFDSGLRKAPLGHAVSFSAVMYFIFSHFLRVVMWRNHTDSLPAALTPRWLADIKLHMDEFRKYAREAIEAQRGNSMTATGAVPSSGVGSGAEVVSTFVRANEKSKSDDKARNTPAGKRSYLDDDELLGNMFIFNLVGFEPPAGAVMHVIPYLAAHSDVQEWLAEEVDAVVGDPSDMDYNTAFPKLVRCLSIVVSLIPVRLHACKVVVLAPFSPDCKLTVVRQYETLRFWGPLGDTTRICVSRSEILTVGSHTLAIPPRTYVNWDFAGAQTDKRVWGADTLEWRPQRWIHIDAATGQEVLKAPNPKAQLAFNAWSGGPRVCPGKMFSQVELVALIAVLVRGYTLTPVGLGSKQHLDAEGARSEMLSVVNDLELPYRAKGERLKDVGVAFEKRLPATA